MTAAEIIAVGSELLTPHRTDTNSLWLTEKLNEIGVEVRMKTIVGDDEARLEEAIRDAVKRSTIIITTGGLGPTEDDVTRQVAARAIDRELVYHDEIEAHLRERFKNWGREMPEINKRQAFAISGADVLTNPNGSAPGMLVDLGDKVLAVLPGPPREMRPMFADQVFPKLTRFAETTVTRRRVMRVAGIGESAVDEAISPIYRSYENVETSILFSRVEIEIHLSARADTAEKAEHTLDELAKKIEAKLGNAVFSANGETMEEVIGSLLRQNAATLSVAESCTGGLIGMRLTEVAGSSDYFLEGAVTYSNDAKIRSLGVSSEIISSFGAVSAETAEAMAAGMRELSGSTHSISVTGIAGPGGATDEKPVGTVFVGYAGENGVRSIKFTFPGDRELVRWRSSQAALEYLRRQIIKADTQR